METARPEMVLVAPGQLGRTVALHIAARLQAAIKQRGVATLALSGGPQTPWVYRDLRELALPWERIEFWFADERCVPERHPASNWYAAADLLFSDLRIRAEGACRIEAERPDHDEVAREYEERLPERLDVTLLELGLDGHLAGLFPGSSALFERERRVIAVETAAKPHHRITVTPRVLDESGELIVLATGRDRAAAVRAALDPNSTELLPAHCALRGTWFVDAASRAA
ncbi:MAG: 6-phosphogluconolactonase [Planctomycetes bacterium]|nr:6-phosphogluconolactonase [Planctomycetota bacterium]